MIFGKTRIEKHIIQQKRWAKYKDRKDRWFAWYPVRISDGRVVWFSFVIREWWVYQGIDNFYHKPTVFYRIVDASHKSPVTIVLEANPSKPKNPLKKFTDLSDATVNRFFKNLKSIKSKKIKRGDIDLPALRSYLELGDKLGEEVFGVGIKNGDIELAVDREFVQTVIDVLGKEEEVYGSVEGKAEGFNAHENSIFYLYPTVGQNRVVCAFPKNLQLAAKSALLKYVRVFGKLKYKPTDKFPYEVEVSKIDELPEVDTLPTLMSLRGRIAGEGKKSEELIREQRDANW